ncbi:MAG: response regulator [Leptolyngbyaceae cyanobacterium MO_188.B28]|nr:response regulator [Leptolyngbyaceae cyanobacterium MO_188.B28]
MSISQTFAPTQSLKNSLTTLSSIHDFLEQLRLISQKRISGQLTFRIQGDQFQQWNLYFSLGRLAWATDQRHPVRRWYRQLTQHCPELVVEPVDQLRNSPNQLRNDKLLSTWVNQGKILQKERDAIIKGHIGEILFDIFQQWTQAPHRPALQMTYQSVNLGKRDFSSAVFPIESAWLQAIQAWEAWRQAGLANYSPNQAPVLWNVQGLRNKLSPMAYQSLAALVDGRRTLRDVAVKSRQDLLITTQSFIPHILQGLIKLVPVGDLQSPLQAVATTPNHEGTPNHKGKSTHLMNSGRPAAGLLSRTPRLPAVNTLSVHPMRPANSTQPVSTPLPASGSNALSIPSGPSQSSHPLVAHIDDHSLHGKMMGHILTHLHYRFIHLQDPVQALMGLIEHKPSLIFLDLAMPIINGYELCTQIRRVASFKNIPIIIVSSNDGIVDRIQAKNVGASDFLAKPIRLKNVKAILQRHIAQ